MTYQADERIAELEAQAARDDEHYRAAMAMSEKHRKSWVEASQERNAARTEIERLRADNEFLRSTLKNAIAAQDWNEAKRALADNEQAPIK